MGPDGPADLAFRCGRAARWLPRALGGSLLAATLLLAFDPTPGPTALERRLDQLVVVIGGGTAWLVVRAGGELRRTFRLTHDALLLVGGKHENRVELAAIDRIDFAPSFSHPLVWIPAALLIERSGAAWRVPALLEDGESFVREIVARAGRDDLADWAAAHEIGPRMARVCRRVGIGYAVAATFVVAGISYRLGG